MASWEDSLGLGYSGGWDVEGEKPPEEQYASPSPQVQSNIPLPTGQFGIGAAPPNTSLVNQQPLSGTPTAPQNEVVQSATGLPGTAAAPVEIQEPIPSTDANGFHNVAPPDPYNPEDWPTPSSGGLALNVPNFNISHDAFTPHGAAKIRDTATARGTYAQDRMLDTGDLEASRDVQAGNIYTRGGYSDVRGMQTNALQGDRTGYFQNAAMGAAGSDPGADARMQTMGVAANGQTGYEGAQFGAATDVSRDAQFRAQQLGLAGLLGQGAIGQGPSAAQGLLERNREDAIAQQYALAQSQRGLAPAAGLRQASRAAENINLQTGRDAAILRAQEQQQAQQALGQVLGAGRGADLGTQQAAIAGLGQLSGQALTSRGQTLDALQGTRGQDIGVAQMGVNAALGSGQLGVQNTGMRADALAGIRAGDLGRDTMVLDAIEGMRGGDLAEGQLQLDSRTANDAFTGDMLSLGLSASDSIANRLIEEQKLGVNQQLGLGQLSLGEMDVLAGLQEGQLTRNHQSVMQNNNLSQALQIAEMDIGSKEKAAIIAALGMGGAALFGLPMGGG